LQLLSAFILAFIIAVAGTAFHQSLVGAFPIGIVLAFSSVLLGSIEMRSLGNPRYFFPVFLGFWMFLVAQEWTGDKLLPANELGLIWTYGSIVMAASITLWPITSFRGEVLTD
jgi:hypothetical protein